MRRLFSIFAAAGFMIGLIACDKVDCKYPNTEDCTEVDTVAIVNPIDTDTTVNFRRAMIEEFTGPGCGTCPPAAEEIKKISNDYPGRVVVVALHAGWFSDGGGNPHDFDLTSDEASLYYGSFGVAVNPIAMINRKSASANPDERLIVQDLWNDIVLDMVTNTPEADVDIDITHSYDAASRAVSIAVDVEADVALTGDYRLAVAITEDYVVGPQTDYRGDPNPEGDPDTNWEDYEHRHVHRANVTDAWGDFVFQGSAAVGDAETVNLGSYTLNPTWAENNCAIVAYVYNEETGEIIQAEEVFVVE